MKLNHKQIKRKKIKLEKKINYIKGWSKIIKKMTIKRIRVKIKIKKTKNFYWSVKLKWKITSTKGKKNQKNKDEIEKKIIHDKYELKHLIKNK
jgi:hypothetical protein